MISCATSAKPVLVLNCAEECAQIVLGTPGDVLFAETIRCPGQSIRFVPTAMSRALDVAGLKASELAGVACVRGPGSFTGLRIAHASMHGLARAAQIPMAGLELHALLADQLAPLVTDEIWIATYARRNQVYLQGFVGTATILAGITPLTVPEAWTLIASRNVQTVLCGSGVRKNTLLSDIPRSRILPAYLDRPSAETLLQAAGNAAFSTEPPAPLYLRKSDAEDNLDAIAASRGISPDEARRLIHDFE